MGITNFPVKESNDVESKTEQEKMPMVPKFRPFYSFPHYYTYSYKNVEEKSEVKDEEDKMEKAAHMAPQKFMYSPYFYNYRFPTVVKPKVETRRKRDVVQPALAYATYPRVISHSYYPSNAFYYPKLIPSTSYHPSKVQLTRTVVKLPKIVVDNTVEGDDNV